MGEKQDEFKKLAMDKKKVPFQIDIKCLSCESTHCKLTLRSTDWATTTLHVSCLECGASAKIGQLG